MNWIELNWYELNWIELNWIELSWIELNWIELNWIELSGVEWSWVELSWVELSWVEYNGVKERRVKYSAFLSFYFMNSTTSSISMTCSLSLLYNLHRLPISVQSSVSSAICRVCMRMSPQALGNTLYALGRLGAYVRVILN